jgi:hypothetical protein
MLFECRGFGEPVWRAEKGHLCGGSNIGRHHPDQREPNAGSCSHLRINNAILGKCNISHVPNILRFTIVMVVVLSQTDQYGAGQMERGERTRDKLGKKGQEDRRTIGANWDRMIKARLPHSYEAFESVRQTISRRCTELIDWWGSHGIPAGG